MPTPSLVIVLPGALPPPSIANDLAAAIRDAQAGAAPTWLSWLAAAPARVQAFDPDTHGCTAFEHWWLARAGHQAGAGRAFGAGLAPLIAGATPPASDPVWLARLGHIRISQDHLALSDAAELAITDDESRALFDAARPVLAADGFGLEPVSTLDWRIVPLTAQPPNVPGATPGAAIDRDIDAWWPQGPATRPWRRVLNEIQMTWHEHPVNDARRARNRPELNTVWLYGGAPAWTPTLDAACLAGGPDWLATLAQAAGTAWHPAPTAAIATGGIACDDTLDALARAEDWGRWLAALSALDASLFAPAQRALADRALAAIELVLTGADRIATLNLAPRRGLARWLPAPAHDWNRWWSSPAS